MGRIVTQVKLTNYADPDKTLTLSALVDTGAAYITLPNAWRDTLGEVEQLAEVKWRWPTSPARQVQSVAPCE